MTDWDLFIEEGGTCYVPNVAGEILLSLSRAGTPGKLKFTVLKDNVLSFAEGSRVSFKVDGKALFKGYVFTKKRTARGFIQVTAYDQLRYFKNRASFYYEGETATALLSDICKSYGFKTGTLAETGIPLTRREVRVTLFDVMEHALQDTEALSGRQYVLYDDAGRITLKDTADLKLDYLLHAGNAEDFIYETSIDHDVCNRVRAYVPNRKGLIGAELLREDAENIRRWGVLSEVIAVQPDTAVETAEALLKKQDRKYRALTVKNAVGDPRVRPGCFLKAALSLGDAEINGLLQVAEAEHRFKEGVHLMTLRLTGQGLV